MIIDEQARRKLRLMGVDPLLDALERQDKRACANIPVNERVMLAVDDAYYTWADHKITAISKRAKPRYPQADLRTLDLIDERGLDRNAIQPAAILHVHRPTPQHPPDRSHRQRQELARMPDLAEQLDTDTGKPGSMHKLIRKYSAYTLLVLDEWLLDHPTNACDPSS